MTHLGRLRGQDEEARSAPLLFMSRPQGWTRLLLQVRLPLSLVELRVLPHLGVEPDILKSQPSRQTDLSTDISPEMAEQASRPPRVLFPDKGEGRTPQTPGRQCVQARPRARRLSRLPERAFIVARSR